MVLLNLNKKGLMFHVYDDTVEFTSKEAGVIGIILIFTELYEKSGFSHASATIVSHYSVSVRDTKDFFLSLFGPHLISFLLVPIPCSCRGIFFNKVFVFVDLHVSQNRKVVVIRIDSLIEMSLSRDSTISRETLCFYSSKGIFLFLPFL